MVSTVKKINLPKISLPSTDQQTTSKELSPRSKKVSEHHVLSKKHSKTHIIPPTSPEKKRCQSLTKRHVALLASLQSDED